MSRGSNVASNVMSGDVQRVVASTVPAADADAAPDAAARGEGP